MACQIAGKWIPADRVQTDLNLNLYSDFSDIRIIIVFETIYDNIMRNSNQPLPVTQEL